jgi:serine/threonine protein kinase
MISAQVRARALARIGETVNGKYHLDALLGVGGMAVVFAATHRNGGRHALKVLHDELSRSEEIRGRFLQEGSVANKVRHPGIVRIVDDDVDSGGRAYLVMEMLEGDTLDARWERRGKRLPLGDVAAVADGVLDVLGAAHAQGIIHRDIKPENVFITADRVVKLMDFGIARVRDGSGKTRTGDLIGTPAFMSPEQAGGRNKEIDARTDVWAVGALLFTLLTGEEVHIAAGVQGQLVFAATQPARSITRVMPTLPEDVAHVIDVALTFDMEGRWASAAAMQNALRSAVRNSKPPAPTVSQSGATQPLVPAIRAHDLESPALEDTQEVAVPSAAREWASEKEPK